MKPLQDLVPSCNKGSRETEPVGSSSTRAGTTGSAAIHAFGSQSPDGADPKGACWAAQSWNCVKISPTTTFVARSRQTEHSRTFPVAGSPSFLHKFMMFRVLPCNIQSRRPWRHRYTVPTLPPSMRRSSLVSRGLNGAAVDADAMRMVTHTFDEVRAAVAAMGSAADVE
ncbi:hypothetical protein ZEAMMB73_Zm00001d049776 [Zea mays]|uniref:Uncharacterized protein n=1 Tax=Zea mays TaxID=4577 RepID=A0A1D6PY41_MAIZE|nr:hypothetical protein ZEAMMB73_Zm00001d049776 [Zea mays]